MSLFSLLKTLLSAANKENQNSTPQIAQIITSELGSIAAQEIPEHTHLIDYGYKVGDLTKKYETGNRGSGYISNGNAWQDPGGTSYGSYQLETNKGTMYEYLKTVDDVFTKQLRKLTVNSEVFKATWKELAKADPEGFEQSQFNYLANKPNGYFDGLKYANKLGWSINNLAMQSAIYSTVNQSGGWKAGIFSKAGIDVRDDLEVQINKLYDARARYFRSLPTGGKGQMTKETQRNIIKNRTVDERKDCLKLIGN